MAAKLLGSAILSIPVTGVRGRKVVMFFQANGFLIMFHIHFTTSQIALTCLTNWPVTSMGGLIWGTSIGDGNHITAIWKGDSLSELCVFFFFFNCEHGQIMPLWFCTWWQNELEWSSSIVLRLLLFLWSWCLTKIEFCKGPSRIAFVQLFLWELELKKFNFFWCLK